MTKPEYMSTDEAAHYLGIKTQTLAKWRAGVIKGPKIPFYRVARRVLYKQADLDAYIESTRVEGGE